MGIINGGTLTNLGVLIHDTLINRGTLTHQGRLLNGGPLTFAKGSIFDDTDGVLVNIGTIESYIDDLYFGAGGTLSNTLGSNHVNYATITNT